MSTPANVLAFFSAARWGSRYGVTDASHETPHKGLDCGLFHGSVDVPALHDGTVVAAAASLNVGHYVTVERSDGLFDTYCHIVLGVGVGQSVRQGDRLGRQALTEAEGGLQWEGQHTHLCLSRTRDGWSVWGYVNLDPTPGVIAVLTNTAGSDGKPIDNNPTTPKRDIDMSSGVTFLKQSTLDTGNRVQNRTVAAVADLGLRHASNWKEFTCAYIDGGPGDTLAQYAKGLGGNPSIILSDADWAAERARLTTP